MNSRRPLVHLALAVALAAAALRPGPAAARAVTVLDLPRPPQPEWFGVYVAGKKAGYVRSSVRVEARDGRKVLVANEFMALKAMQGGRSIERSMEQEKVYEAKPSGRLLSFRSRNEGDGGKREVKGRCDDAGCTAVVESDGPPQELRWPGHHETAEQADPQRLAAARRATVRGAALEITLELRVKKMVDRYVGTALRAAGGVQTRVAVVEDTEEGDRAPTHFEVAPDGRVVEVRLGPTVQRPEAEDQARQVDGRADAMAAGRAVLPGPLPRDVPGSVRYLLRGVPAAYQTAEDPRQAWSAQPDGEVALTVTARRPAAADPGRDGPRVRGAPPAALAEWLQPDAAVDSGNPAVARLAAEVAGATPGAYATAVKLAHYVHGRLRPGYGASSDRASDVLARGEGDCTEHALLLTALARAAGVPARTVNGVVYARYDDGVPALYWHAWVEVHSGDEWIAVDPIFDQPVADATHIAFGRATRPGEVMRLDILQVLGQLRVERAEPGPAR